jgi:hypothetical protein
VADLLGSNPYPSATFNEKALSEMIRLFCWAEERDLNPGFLFLKASYPSDKSKAKC